MFNIGDIVIYSTATGTVTDLESEGYMVRLNNAEYYFPVQNEDLELVQVSGVSKEAMQVWMDTEDKPYNEV